MEIRLLEKSKDGMKVSFLIKGISAPYANALRRAIIEEVPTMAIEEVELKKNSSILYDEIVAHRLGLVPLKTDLKTYKYVEEYTDIEDLSLKQKVTFTLKTTKTGNVVAGDLKSKDPSVTPVYPDMVITKLIKGQSIELQATAILGKGKVHSKWSPGHVYYYNEAKITVNNDEKLLNEYKENYPAQIFDKSGKVDRNLISTPELIDACDGVSKLVEVERKDDSFVFVLESFGQLAPKMIVQEAINQLSAQVDEISTLIKKYNMREWQSGQMR